LLQAGDDTPKWSLLLANQYAWAAEDRKHVDQAPQVMAS
jgi:hypothetical protein